MATTSPIKQNAILLKNISRDITKLNNEVLFIRNELTCIREILSMDCDKVKVEVIEDKPTPMKIDTPTQSQIANKSWFW